MSLAGNNLFSAAKVKDIGSGILACTVFLGIAGSVGIAQGLLEDKIRELRRGPEPKEKLEVPPVPNLDSWKQ